MKINCSLIARSLIAILFVYAGIGKLMAFAQTAGYIGSLGVPLPVIATALVIIVEIPVALLFAYGHNIKKMGYILIGFTALATLLAHRDFSNQMNIIMALKNIAIIGGILLAIECSCASCEVHTKKMHTA
jgi:putative oxidoreductase